MTECSKVFRNLGESYGQLYRTSFNADPVSLKNIETYPFTWFFVAQFDHYNVTNKVFSNEYHCCVHTYIIYLNKVMIRAAFADVDLLTTS